MGMAREKAEIAGLFCEIDQDNSGDLNEEELKHALKHLGLPYGKEYVGTLMQQYDKDRNGSVNFKEFWAYVSQKEAALWTAFHALDVDDSGGVTSDELFIAMRRLGLPVKPEDTHRMVDLLDMDHDNKVTFDEFRRFAVMLPEQQLHKENILCSWMDSADWMEGVEYRLCMTPPKHPMQRFLAGGLAGAISRTTVAPLERLRTMMMADAKNKSISTTAVSMWRDGGLRGLFKGNGATMMKVIPQCAIQMAVYDGMKDLLLQISGGQELSNIQRLAAGFTAGGACTAVVYPIDNLRTHVSLGRSGSYAAITRNIIQTQGMRGLYQGLGASMTNAVVATGLGFTSYEIGVDAFRNFNDGRSPTPGERGFIAGISAIGVMTATMPLEVVTRRMQIQGSPGHPMMYSSMINAFQKMATEEGVKSLYRGTLSSYMKVAPSIGIVRYLYEALIQLGGVDGIRGFRSPLKPKSQADLRRAA